MRYALTARKMSDATFLNILTYFSLHLTHFLFYVYIVFLYFHVLFV